MEPLGTASEREKSEYMDMYNAKNTAVYDIRRLSVRALSQNVARQIYNVIVAKRRALRC